MANKQPLEKNISKAIVNAINSLPRAYVEKRHVSTFCRRGTPDITGCVNARGAALEVKRFGETPTPGQLQSLYRWELSGAVTGVVHSVQEALDIIIGKCYDGVDPRA